MIYLAAKITIFLEKQGKITKLFGYLAHFRLVIWHTFVWLFGALSFGYLAQIPTTTRGR